MQHIKSRKGRKLGTVLSLLALSVICSYSHGESISGCASGRGKRNIGVGVSKSIGHKPSVSVGASRNLSR